MNLDEALEAIKVYEEEYQKKCLETIEKHALKITKIENHETLLFTILDRKQASLDELEYCLNRAKEHSLNFFKVNNLPIQDIELKVINRNYFILQYSNIEVEIKLIHNHWFIQENSNSNELILTSLNAKAIKTKNLRVEIMKDLGYKEDNASLDFCLDFINKEEQLEEYSILSNIDKYGDKITIEYYNQSLSSLQMVYMLEHKRNKWWIYKKVNEENKREICELRSVSDTYIKLSNDPYECNDDTKIIDTDYDGYDCFDGIATDDGNLE